MYTLTTKQQLSLLAIHRNAEVLLLGGVRSGKSLAIAEAAYQCAFFWEPEVNGILAAPTFGQLERNLLEPWRQIAPRGRYEIVQDAKDPHIDCRVGRGKYVKIYLASGKRPDTIEGATVGWLAGTELQQMQTFWKVARRRVSDKRAGRLRWFGDGLTEEGWLSKEVERPGILDIRFNTLENAHNLAPTYLSKMRQVLTKRQWLIYILGVFASPEDSVFPTFKRAIHSLDLIAEPGPYFGMIEPLDKRWPVIIGQDFNLNPMASVFTQYIANELFAIGELIEPGHLQEHTQKLVAWCRDRGINHRDSKQCFVVPDATGGKRNQGDGRTNLFIMQQAGFTVRARPANPLRVDTDQTLLSLLENSEEERRLFFDKSRCPKTIDAIASLRHEDRDKPTNEHSHPVDALKYVAYHVAPMRAPRAKAADQSEPTPTRPTLNQIGAELQKQGASVANKAALWSSRGRRGRLPI
jgi:hypothetical protein